MPVLFSPKEKCEMRVYAIGGGAFVAGALMAFGRYACAAGYADAAVSAV